MCIDDIPGFRREPDTARFWSKVDRRGPDECWLTKRSWNQRGTSSFRIGNRSYGASRIAYMLEKGDIAPGLLVCHSCDDPRCHNPQHLFLGTPQENVDDKRRKGRLRYRGTGKLPPVFTRSPRVIRYSLEERFVRGLDKSGVCWLWTRCVDLDGYGLIMLRSPGKKTTIKAHRLAYELSLGPIPARMVVAHECDINYPPGDITYRRCCNPAHLSLKTPSENTLDCWRKGRIARGERQGRAILNEGAVVEIHALRAEGWTYQALAARFGVTKNAIGAVLLRQTWKHVPIPAKAVP